MASASLLVLATAVGTAALRLPAAQTFTAHIAAKDAMSALGLANEARSAPSSRRDALLLFSAFTVAAAAPLSASADVSACPKNANNCWSTASTDKTAMSPWKWPASTSKGDAVATLKKVLSNYPQAGQSGVDLGGWTVVVDELADKGYMRIEFRSGLGNFAKFLNGGKPFVDDLEISVGDGSVAVRSSSRVGDSDLGVNAKRLNYISAALRAEGWDAAPLKA
mmetsp:Transcript_31802/g.66892  ORF Transcript_31802/g.66892 Transcript_31802/m.66892 type:complete len:222 (-) Transcript_31802:227-892(-)